MHLLLTQHSWAHVHILSHFLLTVIIDPICMPSCRNSCPRCNSKSVTALYKFDLNSTVKPFRMKEQI